MKKIKAGITAPKGYLQAGIHCGIKKRNPDLALVLSEAPAIACGVFTQNSFKAAPVVVTKKHLRNKQHLGVIMNSGNANCLIGQQGILDTLSVLKSLALLIGCKKEELLMCSTGIIGKRLPADKIESALGMVLSALHKAHSKKAAKAIMTTDTFAKEAAYSINIGRKKVTLGGIAKGAGMISPDMATMISVLTTDAKISKQLLQKALKEAVEVSFNSITIDGDMSTNDTVLIMANGLSGAEINRAGADYNKFVGVLKKLCIDLSQMIVKDAEGATKFIKIEVGGAKDYAQAKQIALRIANSPLFKTMCYGSNPNFGRIAVACGALKIPIDTGHFDIYLNEKIAVKSGIAVLNKLSPYLLKPKQVNIRVELHKGKSRAQIFTSDMSPEYVRINAAYS